MKMFSIWPRSPFFSNRKEASIMYRIMECLYTTYCTVSGIVLKRLVCNIYSKCVYLMNLGARCGVGSL